MVQGTLTLTLTTCSHRDGGWPEVQLTSFDFPWTESPQEADQFVTQLFATSPFVENQVHLAQWLFLNQESPAGGVNSTLSYAEFGNVCLQDAAGSPYPALDAWLDA